ncbi:MAG TPA: VWA domain-containing protein [Flavobacteriaceae bacterium]|nr:VWA domain-containing protein [Flavobacteriaceae bacterium]MCB9212766.1 VWA domain-containing protein [Alteromonas sp.]HPF10068.1 VWA domain-containing protein [Flavobacteriaceae bacterium]HQU21367.1 VWA domain-containing protein [Flavobacteriaceae bacterium]HQU63849.1 VWA domain-containing protein [Flavobacteriaceae bacterium]
MYQLEQPIYFYLLFAIPVLALMALWLLVWRHRTQSKFANTSLLKRLSPNRSIFKTLLKVLVLSLALACFSMALVNPKIGTKLETVKREGVDVVFALDVSKSMLAEDIAPNRLEKAKQLITQIINSLAGDRIGIIGYAGSAFPQVPITTDFSSAKLFLNSMNTDMVSSQGTAITEAINMAKTYYNDEEQTNRVLFIVSDGEDHEGNVAAIADEAAKMGIKIFTIGVGTVQGAPIPIKRNGILQFYKRDENNEQVITKLSEDTLKEIASNANGEYLNGSSTKAVVDAVTAILNGMDKKEFEAKQFTDFKDQFQWFLGGALFLLVLDVLLLERKTAWLQKLNLFNEDE